MPSFTTSDWVSGRVTSQACKESFSSNPIQTFSSEDHSGTIEKQKTNKLEHFAIAINCMLWLCILAAVRNSVRNICSCCSLFLRSPTMLLSVPMPSLLSAISPSDFPISLSRGLHTYMPGLFMFISRTEVS